MGIMVKTRGFSDLKKVSSIAYTWCHGFTMQKMRVSVGSYKVRILHSHPEFNSPNHQLVPRNYPGLDRTSWCLCPFHGEPSPADKIHVLPGKLMFPHVLAKIPPITCSTKVYLDFKINSSLQPSRCLALWQRSEATGNPKQKALASLGKDVNPEAWRYAGHPSYCLCN